MTGRSRAIALVVAWGAAWTLPWQRLLDGAPAVRTVLALLLFCAPGYALSRLLDDRARSLASRLPDALLLSTAITGLLGFAGSVLAVSPRWVGLGLWLTGALAFAKLARDEGYGTPAPPGGGLAAVLDGALLVAVAGITARLCFSPVMGADDMTYVARMTWFQQTPELSFRGIIFGGAQLISPRDWLAFWPLCEAIVGTLGGVHGLELTTLYLGPLLALLAVPALYELARTLGLSRRAAVVASALQIVVLLLLYTRDQPGRHFFLRLTEDKFLALYVLAPVVLRLVTEVLAGARGRTLVALTLGWLGVALVHPTALGILFLVAGAYCALELVATRQHAPLLVLAILVPITAAAASVRFIPTTSLHPAYFDVQEAQQANAMRGARERRVDVVAGTRFYGIATRSAPTWARIAYGIVLVVALARARRERVARYVAAATGIAALAIIPFTGFLLGKLLTPFHLWRILAAVPFGIGAAFALQVAREALARRSPRAAALAPRLAPLAPLLAVVLLGATVAYAAANPRTFRLTSLNVPDDWQERLDARVKFDRSRPRFAFADLRAIARALEASLPDGAVVLGDPEVNSLIPSLSAKAVLVAFRSPAQTSLHSGMPMEDARKEWRTYQRVTLGNQPPEETVRYLSRHDVRFVVTATDASWLAATPADLLPRREIARSGPLALYEVLPPPA